MNSSKIPIGRAVFLLVVSTLSVAAAIFPQNPTAAQTYPGAIRGTRVQVAASHEGLRSFGIALASAHSVKPRDSSQSGGAGAIWRQSQAALLKVGRVHAEGKVALTSGRQHISMSFTSDCDWSGSQGLLFLHVQLGPNSYVEIISIGTEQWIRTSDGGGAWQTATSATLTDGPFVIFLPEAILQPGIVAGPAGLEPVKSKKIANLGQTTVNGTPVSHLRLRWKHHKMRFALHVYLDPSTGYWLRKTTRVFGPKRSDSFVIDTRYSKFNDPVAIQPPTGVTQGNIPTSFDQAGGLAVDSSGNVYVADGRNSRIVMLGPDGKVKRSSVLDLHNPQQSTEPCDVAIDGQGNQYVVFWFQDVLVKLGPDGKVAHYGTGDELTEGDTPSAVEVDKAGHVWIATMGGRVEEFSSTGAELSTWQRPGNFSFVSNLPGNGVTDFAIDGNSNMYFTDVSHTRIQEISPDGKVIGQWGTSGSALGHFDRIAVDPNGYAYAADINKNRVQKFTLAGRPLQSWKAGPFSGWDASDGLAVDSAGNVYVGGKKQVQKFSSSGKLLAKWG